MAPPSHSRSVGRGVGFVIRGEFRCKEHGLVGEIGSLVYVKENRILLKIIS